MLLFNVYGCHCRSDFSLKFMSKSLSRVEFQATVIGEKLADEYQVNNPCPLLTPQPSLNLSIIQILISAIILVWVYVLIGFDVSSLIRYDTHP